MDGCGDGRIERCASVCRVSARFAMLRFDRLPFNTTSIVRPLERGEISLVSPDLR